MKISESSFNFDNKIPKQIGGAQLLHFWVPH